jgi:hypothetical protein
MSALQHSIEHRHMNVCVLGRLTQAPMVRYGAGGVPHLTVSVRQAGDCLPFIACQHGEVADTPAMLALAARLHANTPVMVLGAGLALEPDVGEFTPKPAHPEAWRLRLVECRRICEVSVADPAEAKQI